MSQYELGQYIKNNILPKATSQSAIAAQLEVTRQTLSRLLNGHTTLSDDMAIRLSKAYGADADELILKQRAISKPLQEKITENIRSYSSRMWDICADDISEYFARKKVGRDIFPQLIRKLVRCQNPGLTKCDFHAGDNAERKGWDGETVTEEASTNVPCGYSIWELGTNKDPRKKAEEDYNKSLYKGAALEKSERLSSTYIFITPHSWEKAKDWAKGKAALGDYKDVIALDSSDLEQWIEEYPVVQAWLAEKMGISTEGIYSLEGFWAEWSEISNPKISPLIFKQSVDTSSQTLKNWLDTSHSHVFSIQAGTRDEVCAFLGAASQLDDELYGTLTQCIIVDEKADFARLAASSKSLIPVTLNAEATKACIRSFRDRPIIVSRETSMVDQGEPDINVVDPNRENFKNALLSMGCSNTQIDQLATQTNCSPTILRRSLAKLTEDKFPHWAALLTKPQSLLPAFLSGCWHKRKEDDVAFVEALAISCGIANYQEFEKELTHIATMSDSPVWIESDCRGVTSKLECLLVLGPYITEEILDEFFELCELLLSEYDPALDLEKDKRWAAAIYDKTRKSSGVLRLSIADTLIILSVYGRAHLAALSNRNIQLKLDQLVGSLLRDGSARNWLSHNGLLRLYAEISPDSFIQAVKRELRAQDSVFDEMFLPVESQSFGASPDRTDILWALELLAWSKDHVVDACLALAELCRYPCTDNWSNKPIASLNDILLYWRPHTCLDVEERKQLLNQIYKTYPTVGWNLALQTLKRGGMTSGTCMPKYRNWALNDKGATTHGEAWAYGVACREILLSHTPFSTKNIKELVELLDSFPIEDEARILEVFKHWIIGASRDDLIDVRERVRTRTRTRRSIKRKEKISKSGHNYFDGEKLLAALHPKDVIDRHAWLFLKRYVEESLDELEEDMDMDFKARDARISKQRIIAMEEIWEKCGYKGFSQLISLSEDSYIVGETIASTSLPISNQIQFIIDHFGIKESEQSWKSTLAIEGFLRNTKIAQQRILKLVDDKATEIGKAFDAAKFCTLMNFNQGTLEIIEQLDNDAQFQYWQKVVPHYFEDSGIDLNELMHHLLDVGRPLAAFFAAKFYPKRIETSLLLKILKSVAACETDAEPNYKLDYYRLCEFVEELQQRTDVSQDDVANIEFTYAPLLTGNYDKGGIPTLTRVLFTDPKQYFQLIALCYLRKDRKDDSTELGLPTDEIKRKSLVETAYCIIDNLTGIPGEEQHDISSKIDSGKKWVTSLLEIAEEYDRSSVTKLTIGNMFASSKIGRDGIWPNEHARGILEHFQDIDMARGLQTEKMNSRGVTMRPSPDNGDQERELAQSFHKDASKLAIEYPFTAELLRSLGRRYEEDAERHDADGRLEKRIPS